MPRRELLRPLLTVANSGFCQIVLFQTWILLHKEKKLTDEASRAYVAQGIIFSFTQAVSIGGNKVKCLEPIN